ncbi:MAG TPA: NAD(P)/FAD-dependent oxidoreductase [Polyangiaceae bacterium]|nr:NAD(P)/FAD-dependent oxidoreductase [Polyangiaceae bacterium]
MDCELAVVGGGVVGLAIAEFASRRGHSVTLLERESRLGEGTSARNSGVIHAGIYYPEGSLKARSCVRGRELLYQYCAATGIEYRKVGKLIVACSPGELPELEGLAQRAADNGVRLEPWDRAQVARVAPRLRVEAALWSPETGIVDVAGLVYQLARGAREAGATVLPRHELVGIEPMPSGYRLRLASPDGPAPLTAARVVNAAGLGAPRVASLVGLDPAALGYQQYPCKGDYFRLSASGARGLDHLIYPLPVAGGLGIHLTMDLAGAVHAGPDVTYVSEPRYVVDPSRAEHFATAVRRYLPDIDTRDLVPAYAGVRPKLQGPGQPFRDFVVNEEGARGLPGFVNLLGIESPGLTAALALAEEVLAQLSLDVHPGGREG